MKPKVLIVDDEDLSPVYLTRFLGERFDFDYAPNGEAALAAVAKSHPEVILMDVEMPGGMNGYQTCRAIKDDKATLHIPVFFISAHTMTEDRLKAYASGGDDYVSKPFNIEELKYKISLALASQRKRSELAEKARHASNMAMMSIREAASAGAVLGFLSDIVGQTDLEQIADTTLHALQKISIEGGAVQLRDGGRHFSRNSTGACTPVEDAVLTHMASDNRIVDLGHRSAFNYERATIIVYDMPLHDPQLYGRLKDTVVKMAEALDVHMRSREATVGALERSLVLQRALEQNAGLARELGAREAPQRDEHLRALHRLAEGVERAGAAPDSDALRRELQTLARAIVAQAHSAHDQSVELEKSLAGLISSLQAAATQTAATPKADAETTPARFNNVELF